MRSAANWDGRDENGRPGEVRGGGGESSSASAEAIGSKHLARADGIFKELKGKKKKITSERRCDPTL